MSAPSTDFASLALDARPKSLRLLMPISCNISSNTSTLTASQLIERPADDVPVRNVLTVTCVAVGVVTVEDPVEIDEPPGPTPFTDESLAATAVPEADDPVEVGEAVELELALLGDPIVTAEVEPSVVVVLLPYPAVPESPASPPGPTPFADESLAATAVPEADNPVEVGAVVELELALLGDPIVTAEVALSVVVVLLPYPAVPESPASPPGPVLLPAVELLPEATASEGAKNIKNCSYIE